ncbi:MAG: tetratricopeptide repeat protein [Nitrospiraceae bacterium]
MLRAVLLLLLLSTFLSASAAEVDPTQANDRAKGLLAQEQYAKAIPYLRQAAEAGIAEAQYNLGICYLNGQGVAEDAAVANTWFERAAKQGWVDAQFKLAYSYATGRGVTKDLKLAHHWCLEAAKQGDSECQFIVIGNYLEGHGVKKDVAAGLKWANRLATRENPEDLTISGRITSARLNLSRAYRQGLWGIPVDNLEAYTWLLLTNESKRDFSVKMQEEIIAEMRALEVRLSDGDKRRGRQNAEALIKRKLHNFDRRFPADL